MMIPRHRAPTHPGEMLLEEFLKPMKLTQVEAAEQMGISLNRVNELIRGKRGITADTALRLATLLKTSPEFWMNLQAAWDLHHAKHAMAGWALRKDQPGTPRPKSRVSVAATVTKTTRSRSIS